MEGLFNCEFHDPQCRGSMLDCGHGNYILDVKKGTLSTMWHRADKLCMSGSNEHSTNYLMI